MTEKRHLTYGIIGTGAIGGYYGGRLAQAGFDVHFLFHRDYDYVAEHGLQVDSCDGSFYLPHVNAYHDTADMPPCDVVMVSLKTVNNKLLPTLLPPLLKSDTLVVLIQNGIGVEEDVQKMMPNVRLAAGVAYICSAKTQPGRVNHQYLGRLSLANYSCPDASLLNAVVGDLTAGNVKAKVAEYHEARWKKAVWNMTFNGMSVVEDAQTDQLANNPVTGKLIYRQMLEVIAAARALGVEQISDSYADEVMDMTRKMKPYSPSMKLDYEFHRPMEIYYLYTRPIAMARSAGVDMPLMQALEDRLRSMDAVNHG